MSQKKESKPRGRKVWLPGNELQGRKKVKGICGLRTKGDLRVRAEEQAWRAVCEN